MTQKWKVAPTFGNSVDVPLNYAGVRVHTLKNFSRFHSTDIRNFSCGSVASILRKLAKIGLGYCFPNKSQKKFFLKKIKFGDFKLQKWFWNFGNGFGNGFGNVFGNGFGAGFGAGFGKKRLRQFQ